MACTFNCNQGRDCSCGQREPMFKPTFEIEGPHSSDGPGLFASPWFWGLGLAGIALWSCLYLLFVYFH